MLQVSIIIPLYNKGQYIERAIDSVLNQTVEDFRLIVVDDGSTDNGPDVVRKFIENDNRITLLHQENKGPGSARNAGIAQVDSKYVAFLDADDEWCPWYLANTLKAISENNVAMVTTMYYEGPGKKDSTQLFEERDIKFGQYYLKGDENPMHVANITGFINAWNSVLTTEMVRKYDGFYEKDRCIFGEDMTLLLRIAFAESFMLLAPTAVWYHSENSCLGPATQARPLEPYLSDTDVVLRYCPPRNYQLVKKVMDIYALIRAGQLIKYGKKIQALKLLIHHPVARIYRSRYIDCFKQMIPGFRLWARFKNSVIKPIISKYTSQPEKISKNDSE